MAYNNLPLFYKIEAFSDYQLHSPHICQFAKFLYLNMTSKAPSRISKKVAARDSTPKNSEYSPSLSYISSSHQLKSKLEALQDKYSEFINNCSNLFSEENTTKKEKRLQIPAERIVQKQKKHNEYYKENVKLKRENTVLSKTVNDLSTKVTELEIKTTEPSVLKEPEDHTEIKKQLIEKQEYDICLLQQELEKTKYEIGSMKKIFKENERVQPRCVTPNQNIGKKNPYLRLPKQKAYSPVSRNRKASPISRSVSPKDRAAHTMKKELTNLKTELVKIREERDLYKVWKDYCSNHPPVPPAIHTIINHYEIEIKKIDTLHSILKNKTDNLTKSVTELLNAIDQKGNLRLNKDIFLNIKTDVRNKIKNLQEDTSSIVEKIVKSASKAEITNNTHYKMERENKDFEEILNREKRLADLYAEAVKIKCAEINDLKATISSSERFISSITAKATESNFDVSSSVASTPYHKNVSFELSFATRDKSFFNSYSIGEFIDQFEKTLTSSLVVLSEQTSEKNNKLREFQKRLKEAQQNTHSKIILYKNKIDKQEFLLNRLHEEVQNEKKISVKAVEELENAEKELENCKNQMILINKKDVSVEDQQELLSLKEKLKSKEQIIDNFKESLLKEKENVKKNLNMILGYENELDKANEDMKKLETENRKLLEQLGKKEKDSESLKEMLRNKENHIERLKDEISKSLETIEKVKNASQEIEKDQEIEKYKREIYGLNEQINEKHEIIKKYQNIEEDNKNKTICLEKYAEEVGKYQMEIENINEIIRENKSEIEELQRKMLENEKNAEKLDEEIKMNLRMKKEIEIAKNEIREKDMVISQIKKDAEVLETIEGLREKIDGKDKEIKKLVKEFEIKDKEIGDLELKILEYEKDNAENERKIAKCNEKLKLMQKLNTENHEMKAAIGKLEDKLKAAQIAEAEIKQLHKIIEMKDEELKEVQDKEQEIEALHKIIAQNKKTISQLQIYENECEKLSEIMMENEEELKKKDMMILDMTNKVEATESTISDLSKQILEFSDLNSKLSETTINFEKSNSEISELKLLISKKEQELKSLPSSLENHKLLEKTLETYSIELNILSNKVSELSQIIQNKDSLISSLTQKIQDHEKLASENLSTESYLKEIKTLQNIIQEKESQIISLKSSSQSPLEKLQTSELELIKLKNDFTESKQFYKNIEKIYEESKENLQKAKTELLKSSEKLAQSEKQLTRTHENMVKLDDENKILKDNLHKSDQDIEKYTKLLETLSQTQEDLKNLQYQYEISQSKLEEYNINSSSSSIKPQLSEFFSPTLTIKPSTSLSLLFTKYFNMPLTENSLSEIIKAEENHKDQIKEVANKNSLLESAYKKIKSDIAAYQESCNEKFEDLKLDNYVLAKENDELKKRYSSLLEDQKIFKEETEKNELKQKELLQAKNNLEIKLAKLQTENEEKNKKISQISIDLNNLNIYSEKILNEKENLERSLTNSMKNVSLSDSDQKNQIISLQQKLSSLENINSNLEKSKTQMEGKFKKLINDKEELSGKLEDLMEEIEIIKHTRSQQEHEILSLIKEKKQAIQLLENEQKLTNEYKNKLATYMCNAKALRSLTPQPTRIRDDDSLILKPEDIEDSPSRHSRTLENDSYTDLSLVPIESILNKLKRLINNETPPIIIDWCKEIIGNENYVFRYPDNQSEISEESKFNVDTVSIISEGNQELSYRAHAKMTQQKSTIESLIAKVNDKKQRIRICKNHIKTLQGEIRKLDVIVKNQNTFDIEYLKSTVLKFAEKLKGLDADSLTMLQIIYSQLGLSVEQISLRDNKRKWGIFSKKP